jgi:hypothetical protein
MYESPILKDMLEVCDKSTPATAALEASILQNVDSQSIEVSKFLHINNFDTASLSRVLCQFSRLSTTAHSA